MSNSAYNNAGFIGDDDKAGKESHEKSIPVELSVESTNGFQASDDYEPYAHRNVASGHPLTNMETTVHLMKCALGTGIFAMPNAFNHAGYVVGLIGTVILGSIATYCVHILVNLHYELCKWKKVPSMNYPGVAEAALQSGPKSLQRFAPIAPHVINIFLLTYQIGSSCIYVVFIATNLNALLAAFDIDIDVRLIMAIILLPLILINWVRKLKYLAPFATIGNIILIASFAVIFYYIFREPLTFEDKRPYADISEFPLFFDTVLFALEAIGVIMPLENEMKNPKKFRGVTGILNRSMVLIVSLYIALGFLGYIKYGSEIKSTITINLPEEVLAQVCKAMIAFGVFTSHALYIYVAIDILWNEYICKRLENSNRKLLWEYALRTVVVFITFILAVAIPNLSLFISLIGALSLSTLGILFPPFLECVYKWNRTSGSTKAFMIFRNTIICVIGLAGFVIGTTLSVKDIIKTYI